MKKIILFTASVIACTVIHTASLLAQPGPGKHDPHAAFDIFTNAYLLTYDFVNPDLYIRGQLLNADASALGSELAISASQMATFQAVAYDSTHGTYLTVWNQHDDGDNDIYGQFIDSRGLPILGNFQISDTTPCDQWRPSVAFDEVNGRFLVVWIDERTAGTYHLYGQLVNADGTLIGGNFIVFDGADAGRAAITYDGLNQRFLVAWNDESSGTNDIYGQLVNADGSLSGTHFPISDPAEPDDQSEPAAVYNTTSNQYLLVWQDKRNSANYTIYGQRVNADGTLDGGNMQITAVASDEQYPDVAYDDMSNRFLVIWHHSIGLNQFLVNGQYLLADGSLDGAAFQVSTDISDEPKPSVVFNPLCANYLVSFVFAPNPMDPTEVKNLIVGDPCETMPPTVIAKDPDAGAVDVPTDAVVTATFSEELRASTITADTFFLDNSASGTVTYDAATKTATFTPAEDLEPKTTYTATITTNVKDLVGNAMASDTTWSFMTAATPTPGGGCSLMPQKP